MASDSSIYGGYLIPAAVFTGSFIFSVMLHFLLKGWLRKIAGETGERLFRKNILLLYALILCIGLYFALRFSAVYPSFEGMIDTAIPVALIFIFGALIASSLNSGE